MDDAGPALRGVAADMRAGQAEILAQEVNQQRSILGGPADPLAVHHQRNVRHGPSLGITLVITLPTRRWHFGHALFVHRTTHKKQRDGKGGSLYFRSWPRPMVHSPRPIAKTPIGSNN